MERRKPLPRTGVRRNVRNTARCLLVSVVVVACGFYVCRLWLESIRLVPASDATSQSLMESLWALGPFGLEDSSTPRPRNFLPSLAAGRGQRFPSIEDRVRVYMGDWYLTPCDSKDNDNHHDKDGKDSSFSSGGILYEYNHTDQTVLLSQPWRTNNTTSLSQLRVTTNAEGNDLFFAKRSVYENCEQSFQNAKKRYLKECNDISMSVPLSLLWDDAAQRPPSQGEKPPPPPPILLRISDGSRSYTVPSFHHCRRSRSLEAIQLQHRQKKVCSNSIRNTTLSPIVWNLNSARYMGNLQKVTYNDYYWRDKKDMAVFRGTLTSNEKMLRNVDDAINCRRLSRCRLAMLYGNSSLVNAKLTPGSKGQVGRLRNTTFNGVNVAGQGLSVKELLQHKAIIFLPGNGTNPKRFVPPLFDFL